MSFGVTSSNLFDVLSGGSAQAGAQKKKDNNKPKVPKAPKEKSASPAVPKKENEAKPKPPSTEQKAKPDNASVKKVAQKTSSPQSGSPNPRPPRAEKSADNKGEHKSENNANKGERRSTEHRNEKPRDTTENRGEKRNQNDNRNNEGRNAENKGERNNENRERGERRSVAERNDNENRGEGRIDNRGPRNDRGDHQRGRNENSGNAEHVKNDHVKGNFRDERGEFKNDNRENWSDNKEVQTTEGAANRPPRLRTEGGAGRGERFRGGRQYDRRSGTGHAPNENKKAGYGKGNWGREGKDDALAVQDTVKEEKEVEEPTAPAAEGAATTDADKAPAQPEKALKGLDEYLEERKAKAVKIEAPKPREANEGVDQSAWASYVPLHKKDEESAALGQKKKEVAKDKKKDVKEEDKEKHVRVDSVLRVSFNEREDRPRKGPKPRYNNRDRPPREQQQGGNKEFTSNVNDFPTLSSPPQEHKSASPNTNAARS